MRQKGRRLRQFCRQKCKSAYHRQPLDFIGAWGAPATHPADAVRNDPRSAHSTGLKTDAKHDRPWRVVAGPAAGLDPVNLAIPLDPETAARSRRANHRYQAETVLTGPRDGPIDWIGGGDVLHRKPKVGE